MTIKSLTLFTNSLSKQRHFYGDILGLECIEESEVLIGFQVGSSRLYFEATKKPLPAHFAFNIPFEAVLKAKWWLISKDIELLSNDGKTVMDFPNWHANALYFKDADGNIVELIGRKQMNYEFGGLFNAKELKNISEIAIATTYIKPIFDTLNSQFPVPVFSGDFNRFCAAGNDEGLFILVNKNEKKWFPNDQEIEIADFKFEGDHKFEYTNGKILLNSL